MEFYFLIKCKSLRTDIVHIFKVSNLILAEFLEAIATSYEILEIKDSYLKEEK